MSYTGRQQLKRTFQTCIDDIDRALAKMQSIYDTYGDDNPKYQEGVITLAGMLTEVQDMMKQFHDQVM